MVTGGAAPPQVRLQFSVGSYSNRTSVLPAQKILSGTVPPTPTGSSVSDGYAILPYGIMQSGLNALPPGTLTVTTSISSTLLSTGGGRAQARISTGAGSSFIYCDIANPLAVFTNPSNMINTGIGYYSTPNAGGDTAHQVLSNGSPAGNPASANIPGSDIVTQLMEPMAPNGPLSHGSSSTQTLYITDRSLIANLYGKGISNLRVQRADLQWTYLSTQTPTSPITNPFSSLNDIFAPMEDYPINSPNDSLDYPNITSDNVTFVDNPNVNPQDPTYQDASLTAATPVTSPAYVYSLTTPQGRTLNPTPFSVTLNVPPYQPSNTTQQPDSTSTQQSAGYMGNYAAFLDTLGTGLLSPTGGNYPANRWFYVAAGVVPNFRFFSSTSTVDLGSLPTGAGELQSEADFVPDSPEFSGMFQPFNVTNVGNVNLLNLNVARFGENLTGSQLPWQLLSNNGNEYDWIDAGPGGGAAPYYHVRTDIDYASGFSLLYPFGVANNVLQKPRVGDRSGTTMTRNPVVRANAHIPVPQGPLLDGANTPAPAPPRITVTPPFGLPADTYTSLMRVIEAPGSLTLVPGTTTTASTPFTNPGFSLTYKAREAQLTSKPDIFEDPLIDNYETGHDTFVFDNDEPAAFRDIYGNLHVAFSSTRGSSFVPAGNPVAAATTRPDQLFVASLQANPSTGLPTNPLLPNSDLDGWQVPSGSTGYWFSQDAGPYPSSLVSLQNLFLVPPSYTVNGPPKGEPARYEIPGIPCSAVQPVLCERSTPRDRECEPLHGIPGTHSGQYWKRLCGRRQGVYQPSVNCGGFWPYVCDLAVSDTAAGRDHRRNSQHEPDHNHYEGAAIGRSVRSQCHCVLCAERRRPRPDLLRAV